MMTSVPQNTGNIKNNVNSPKREQEMLSPSPLKHGFTPNIGVLHSVYHKKSRSFIEQHETSHDDHDCAILPYSKNEISLGDELMMTKTL